MISEIKDFLDLLNRRPPAIDYFFFPPHMQAVPDVAMKKSHHDQQYFLSGIGIRNLSRRVIKGIRIKLPFTPKHAPVVYGSDGVENEHTYDPVRAQITLPALDPDGWISVHCFLVRGESEQFEEPQVLIEDRMMSRVARELSLMRPYAKFYFLSSLAVLAIVGATAYITYKGSKFNPRVRAVQEAYDPSAGCHLNAYAKSEVTRAVLSRHQLGEKFLLSSNKVATHAELLAKDYVVICE